MKGKKILFSFLALCTANSIYAACSIPTGWYAEGNIGATKFYGQSYPSEVSNQTSGKAWNVSGGYKFTPFIGAEAGYTRYAPTRITAATIAPGTLAQVQHVTIDVAARLMLPIKDTGFEPFAKLGVGNIHSQVNHISPAIEGLVDTSTKTKNGPYWAGGLAYYFTPNFSANVQYAQARGNSGTGTPSAVTAGLSFLFGT